MMHSIYVFVRDVCMCMCVCVRGVCMYVLRMRVCACMHACTVQYTDILNDWRTGRQRGGRLGVGSLSLGKGNVVQG